MAFYKYAVIGNCYLKAVGGKELYQFASWSAASICPFCLFVLSSSFPQPKSAFSFKYWWGVYVVCFLKAKSCEVQNLLLSGKEDPNAKI